MIVCVLLPRSVGGAQSEPSRAPTRPRSVGVSLMCEAEGAENVRFEVTDVSIPLTRLSP